MLRLGGLDLGDAPDQLDDFGDVGVGPHHVGLLGPLQQRLPAGVQAGPAGLEDVGVAVGVGQQLLGQCLLGGHVVHEPVEPGHQGLPRGLVGQVDGRAAQGVDLLDVDGLEQVLAGREVPVEGADPDPGPAGDVLQGGRLAVLGERLPAGGDQLLVVPPGVGSACGRWESNSVAASVLVIGEFSSEICKTEATSV